MRDFYPIDELFFCDIETNGLKVQEHGVFEFSWAVGLGPVKTAYGASSYMKYLFDTADPEALKVNGYTLEKIASVAMTEAVVTDIVDEFVQDVSGKVWVNANPAFDARFMSTMLWDMGLPNNEPWFYRLLDIQAYEAGLSRGRMLGLSHLVEHYRSMGYSITANDHTSAKDVEATRDLWLAIVDKYNLAKDN